MDPRNVDLCNKVGPSLRISMDLSWASSSAIHGSREVCLNLTSHEREFGRPSASTMAFPKLLKSELARPTLTFSRYLVSSEKLQV
jgi:hypothetical protein